MRDSILMPLSILALAILLAFGFFVMYVVPALIVIYVVYRYISKKIRKKIRRKEFEKEIEKYWIEEAERIEYESKLLPTLNE